MMMMSSSSTAFKETCTTLGDQTIHYLSHGSGSHPVLLLPGALGTASSDFLPTIQGINSKDQLTVIAWDPPGYGKSRPPRRSWPLDFFDRDAALAVRLMSSLGHESFSLAGWSDGGITAMIAAAENPERVRKLVVWGANAFISKVDMEKIESVRDVSKWSEGMRKPMEDCYGIEEFPKLWNEWCDAYLKISTASPDGEICAGRLKNIKCSTLIVHGDKDAMLDPIHPDCLRDNIVGSRLHRFPDGKHNLHFKYKKEFNVMVEDFLNC